MRLSRIAYLCALGGYGTLVATLIACYGWLAPEDLLGRAVLMLLLVPLTVPLWGLARGRADAHARASVLALFYLGMALAESLSAPLGRSYAYCALAASLLFFLGCFAYSRLPTGARPLATGVPRLQR